MADDMNMALDEEELSKRKQAAEDMSKLCDEKLEAANALAKAGNLNGAVELLLATEKQTRQGGDVPSTSRLAVAIVQLCFENRELAQLREQLVLLSKRRGQLKTAVQRMVQEAMTFIDKLDDRKQQRELIDTLIEITDGKIYVEVERARLTRTLAGMQESDGELQKAAETLRSVQVETFGAMDKVEKTDYILEQVRLCLDADDYVRAQILANKINRKYLLGAESAVQELKLRFYRLMVRYHRHEKAWLDMARDFQSIYHTPCIQKDDKERADALEKLALHATLAPHDNEQADVLARVAADDALEDVPPYKALVQFFSTPELMRWPRVHELYAAELAKHTGFEKADAAGWAVLQQRVVEHNVRVIAKYYSRVRLTRVAALLDVSPDMAEQYVADLVVAGSIYARIDRPTGIINFVGGQSSGDLLNKYSAAIGDLMRTIENTTHLVSRERMQHGVD